ncbi:Protein TIFY 5A [Striga hermonthica]|uniref:Protein TIFY n=1 Tax=Striga hermonthica TaxID=68872 RepID=A0A9N7NJZ0_STRHE|nr:Protein TIFY 5A [Striga hermonthica]
MKNRNCNLELRLVTPSVFSHSSSDCINGRPYNSMPISNEKPLTVFYNGEVASCDATELQARTIIFLASKEVEEKSNSGLWYSPCPSPGPISSICSPSMKRSLQRFLEKRKARAQSMSPYSI